MSRSRRIALIAVLLGLLGLLAASAEGAAPLVRHTVPGIGFSVGVPSSWQAIDYRQVLTPGVVERLVKENPNLAQLLQALSDPSSGVRFFAADPHTTKGFATNLNLVVAKIPQGVTANVYADAAAGQLLALPNVIRPMRRQSIQLPAGPAARLRYGLRLSIGGKQLIVTITQYVLVRGPTAFVVTYTTLPVLSAKLAPVFEASARSIRLRR